MLVWLGFLWIMNCGGNKETVKDPVGSEATEKAGEAAKSDENGGEPVLSEVSSEEVPENAATTEDAIQAPQEPLSEVDKKSEVAADASQAAPAPVEAPVPTEAPAAPAPAESTPAPAVSAASEVVQQPPVSEGQPASQPATTLPKEVKAAESCSNNKEAYSGPSFKYIVEHGETLTKISRLIYGKSSHWKDIHDSSSGISSNPNLIFPGDVLIVPLLNQKAKDFSETYTKNYTSQIVQVTVKRGDCLRKIAKKYFGDELYWRQIWKENAQVISKPALILPGMKLEFTLMTKDKKAPAASEEVKAPSGSGEEKKPSATEEEVKTTEAKPAENLPAESAPQEGTPKEPAADEATKPAEEEKKEEGSAPPAKKDGYSADDI